MYFVAFGIIIKIIFPKMRVNGMNLLQYIDKNRLTFFTIVGFLFGFICMTAVLLILVGVCLLFAGRGGLV